MITALMVALVLGLVALGRWWWLRRRTVPEFFAHGHQLSVHRVTHDGRLVYAGTDGAEAKRRYQALAERGTVVEISRNGHTRGTRVEKRWIA